jgi:hypothetical protein
LAGKSKKMAANNKNFIPTRDNRTGHDGSAVLSHQDGKPDFDLIAP